MVSETERWNEAVEEGLGSPGLTLAFVVGSVVAVPVTAGFVGLGVVGLVVRSLRDATQAVVRFARAASLAPPDTVDVDMNRAA
jgi:hypothetical protein